METLCPFCHQRHKISEAAVRKPMRCPNCQRTFTANPVTGLGIGGVPPMLGASPGTAVPPRTPPPIPTVAPASSEIPTVTPSRSSAVEPQPLQGVKRASIGAMRKPLIATLAALGGLAVLCLLWKVLTILVSVGSSAVAQPELRYEGQSLTDWISSTKDTSPRVRSEAVNALAHMAGDSKTARQALIGLLRDREPNIRVGVIEALGELGTAGKDALPGLKEALKDPNVHVRVCVVKALGKLSPVLKDAVPALTEALRDTDVSVRVSAMETLVELGPTAEKAQPALTSALTEALQDRQIAVRLFAAEALGKLGPAAKEAVPALTVALKDPDARFRHTVIDTLEKLGPAAKEAVPALTEVLRRDDVLSNREAAAKALREVGRRPRKPSPR